MAFSDATLYPLQFEPVYKEKVWGGRRLEHLGRTLPGAADAMIGESWELTDLADTAVSGGGGGPQRSIIGNGALRGRSLHEVIEARGSELLGRLAVNATGDFPLLLKFLDAGQNVSVQVHPSPEYARNHPEAHLKSEAWYILHADPEAVLYKGVQPDVTPQQFRDVIDSNDADAVARLLIALPARVGDCHYLPSGTCHALGAGILVAEIQTPSDTTFRVFDWGRTGRELHIEQAMQCIDFGPPDVARNEKRAHVAGVFTAVSRLVRCEHFRIEKVRMAESYEQELPYDQPAVWMVLEGAGRIDPGNGADPVAFRRGQTMLMPANMNDARVIMDEDTVWLEVTFPIAVSDAIA